MESPEYNGQILWAPDGVDFASPFEIIAGIEDAELYVDPEDEERFAMQAQLLWEFIVPAHPWLPDIAARCFDAATMFGIRVRRKKNVWGAGDKKNAALELKRLKLQGRSFTRRGRGELHADNDVARHFLELAAGDGKDGGKFVHRLVMFVHLLTRGDLFLGADGAELGALLGRGRRGLKEPLKRECERLLGIVGMHGVSVEERRRMSAIRQGNDSRMGGRWARVENSWAGNS